MSDPNLTAYQFKPLPDNQHNAIRVLFLFPPGEAQPRSNCGVEVLEDHALSGSIRTVLLGSIPFQALSYEWGGTDQRTRQISIRGENDEYEGELRITEALYSALDDIRPLYSSTGVRVVWADGICINQEDLGERSQQVAIMGDIYRTASQVITYIGADRDNSRAAIELASALRDHALGDFGGPNQNTSEDLVKAGFPPPTDSAWEDLHSLLQRSWASRCWCALEFLLNKDLIMLCGRTQFPWYLFAELCLIVFKRRLPVTVLPKEDPLALTECFTHLRILRFGVINHNGQFNLRVLLESFHPFQASDPRDKIYSLLGLAIDRDQLDLPIDYTMNVEDLYFTALHRSLMASSDNVAFLMHNFSNKAFNLPSWVPDWSNWVYGSLGVFNESIYLASGETQPELQVHEAERRLDISGCLVDRITAVGSPIGPHYRRDHPDDIPSRQKWLGEQEALIAPLSPYPGGIDVTDALWRTLIGDMTFEQKAATDDYRLLFDTHKKSQEDLTADDHVMAKEFIDAVRRKSRNRRLATTERGYLAAVPENSAVGDTVCMIQGAKNLFVIREKELQRFILIGLAYVHGLMTGEVLRADWYEKCTISLV